MWAAVVAAAIAFAVRIGVWAIATVALGLIMRIGVWVLGGFLSGPMSILADQTITGVSYVQFYGIAAWLSAVLSLGVCVQMLIAAYLTRAYIDVIGRFVGVLKVS
jgi:hypothetical protein